MARIFAPFVFVLASLSAPASAQTPPDRFVLCAEDCLLVDNSGALVTTRRFGKLNPFDGPVATFIRKEKAGAIDRAGRTILKAKFDTLGLLADRFLVASTKDRHGEETSAVYDVKGRLLYRKKGPALLFGAWAGQLYHYEECPVDGRINKCRFVFLNDRGQASARFSSFFVREDRFAEVQDENGLRGFIDTSLRYIIPPVYRYTQEFRRDLAAVTSPDGGRAVIDRSGRVVIPPGRYKSVFLSDSAPLVTAFRAGQPNCQVFVRPDGSEMKLPPGICGDTEYSLEPYGYALVRREKGRLFGTVDAAGRTRVPAIYRYLTPYNEKYLVFADAPDRAKNYGLVGVDGRVVIDLQDARIESYGDSVHISPGKLRELLIVRTADGVGLMDFNGKWRVPPRYYAAKVISPDLIALESDGGSVTAFADGNGKMLPLLSSYIGIPSKPSGTFRISRCDRVQGSFQCAYGLADRTGNVVLSPRFDAIEEKDGGLFHVRTHEGYQTLWGVYDSRGNEVIQPIFTELDRRAGLQPVVANDQDYRAVLIDTRGTVLARYHPRSGNHSRE